MKINAALVTELRNARSWSQEELSIAAGLNLRTVQRIESMGTASLQSRKAVAAAFDIEVSDLDYREKPIMTKHEYKILKFDVKGWLGGKVDTSAMEAELNRYGAEGWDLFHISEVLQAQGQTTLLVATMRRMRQ